MSSQLGHYLSRMTPQNLWPAAHTAWEARQLFEGVQDREATVLRWKTNERPMHDDLLAAWLMLGYITLEQACATSAARGIEDDRFLTAYRLNPPPVTHEQRAEARAAFGPDVTLMNVITGRTWTT